MIEAGFEPFLLGLGLGGALMMSRENLMASRCRSILLWIDWIYGAAAGRNAREGSLSLVFGIHLQNSFYYFLCWVRGVIDDEMGFAMGIGEVGISFIDSYLS